MYGGKEIKIEGETYTLPPISLGQLRNGLIEKFKLHDEMVQSGKIWEFQTLRGEIIFSAFRRNYPDFPEEKFFNFLDLTNTSDFWLYVLGASGIGSGETPAAEPKAAVDGTSSQSTELSSQPTAGPTPK